MRHAQRGSTLVEFAISAMVLLVLVFGIMEFALAIYAYHTISTAAELGSRWAMVRGIHCPDPTCPASQDDVRNYVKTQTPLLDTSKIDVDTNWANTGNCSDPSEKAPGCTVNVKVSYDFTFALPFVWNAPLQLSSTSQSVISE
jgi:Flp pilus assembly protein TadG